MAPRAANAGAVAQEVEAPMHDDGIDGPLVYFIQSVNGGPVKIGFVTRASLLPNRVASLQTGQAYPLEVLKTIPGGSNIENQMHARFGHWRLTGEWFLPSKDLETFCGRSLMRRGEAASLQKWVDRAYTRGYEAGYDEGRWQGEKALVKRIYAEIGTPEDWDRIEAGTLHLPPNGAQMGSSGLGEVA